jgi:spermidine/putrescine transport system substrate-binding protein
MIKKIIKDVCSKLFIIFIYIGITIFALYFPEIINSFFEQKQVLNVYTPADMITQEVAEKFEKETGIKVHLKYFDTNEELLAKFKIDKGLGYDLIIVSDHIVKFLLKEKLLKEIDYTKVKDFSDIDPRLCGHKFDQQNLYTIPYAWSTYGIMFKKNTLKDQFKDVSWDFIFQNPNSFLKQKKEGLPTNYKICMINEPLEAIFLASIYLFGKTEDLTDENLEEIKKLLIQQKSWVEIYMLASLQYYLFGDVVPLAVTSSAFAKKIIEISDKFDFVVPEKGSVIAIDSLAIPRVSEKDENTYKLINFLLDKENLIQTQVRYGYNPSNTKSYELVHEKFLKNQSFFPNDEKFKKLHLINDQIDPHKVERLWFEVRVS